MQKREHVFVDEALKVLKQLDQQWFPPGLKSPEGYFYGCGYCDMECGNHKNHDADCLLQMAKNVLLKVGAINTDPSYEVDYKGLPRLKQDADDLRKYFIRKLILDEFYKPILDMIIPLDLSEPENKNVICLCHMEKVFKANKRQHSKHCVFQKLAKILSNLYQV